MSIEFPSTEEIMKALADLTDPPVESLDPVLHTESPRGMILVGAARLEERLEAMLLAALPQLRTADMFGGYQPLSTFSAKINFAWVLGLLDDESRKALHAYRRLRNEAAHSVTPALQTSGDETDTSLIRLIKTLIGLPAFTRDAARVPSELDERGRLLGAVMLVIVRLDAGIAAHTSALVLTGHTLESKMRLEFPDCTTDGSNE